MSTTGVPCDRCDDNPAVIVVRCYNGCSHQQCAGCARQTQQERDDSEREIEADLDRLRAEEEAIEYDPAFAARISKASLFDIDYMKLAFGRTNGRSTPTR